MEIINFHFSLTNFIPIAMFRKLTRSRCMRAPNKTPALAQEWAVWSRTTWVETWNGVLSRVRHQRGASSRPTRSVLHSAGPPASGWQLPGRTCNCVTSLPYWPATLYLAGISTRMSNRLEATIVVRVDGRNLIGSLKGAIFPRHVGRPTPGYIFQRQSQSICVSMACNEHAMLSF